MLLIIIVQERRSRKGVVPLFNSTLVRKSKLRLGKLRDSSWQLVSTGTEPNCYSSRDLTEAMGKGAVWG
jgi:hypothetical protein